MRRSSVRRRHAAGLTWRRSGPVRPVDGCRDRRAGASRSPRCQRRGDDAARLDRGEQLRRRFRGQRHGAQRDVQRDAGPRGVHTALTLADGSHVATLSTTAGTLSAVANGTNIAFTVHGATSLASVRARDRRIDRGQRRFRQSLGSRRKRPGRQGLRALGGRSGHRQTTNEAVTVAASYSLTLSEGSGSAVVDNSDSTVSGSGHRDADLHADRRSERVGSRRRADGDRLGGNHGDAGADGPRATASTFALSTACASIGVTRVFNGSNCDIGFDKAGPVAPDVYDVIPLPTQDLPGRRTTPRRRSSRAARQESGDVAYDVTPAGNSAQTLRQQPTGGGEHREHETRAR